MFLNTEDAAILVFSYGNARRNFVAHGGWVGSGELWAAPFERLSRSWRAVTYDHRGTGATRNTAPAITFELLVTDLFRVLDALEIETCVLAGESGGAMVVLEAVLRQPGRFSGLVIIDGRYVGGPPTPAQQKRMAGCKANFPATMEAFVNACVPEEDCEAERAWGKLIVNRSSGTAAVQLFECLEHVDLTSRLSSINVPTLILHGDDDQIVPIGHAGMLTAKIVKGSTLKVIPGAAHGMCQVNKDQINKELLAFLQGGS